MTIILIALATALLAFATILPWVPWPHGLIRMCDFPRLQIAVLAIALIPVTIWLVADEAWMYGLVAAQALVASVQGALCLRFTPLHPVQSLSHEGPPDDPATIRVISSNVKQSNRDYRRLLDLVADRDPDIVIAMEVDEKWVAALQPLRKGLPHVVERPYENAYGMALYSRLPLTETELRHLVLDEVPSIRTAVTLKSGDRIRLYAVHPEPPVPYEDTIGRDAELALVAKEIEADDMPAIVTGDLNDVAWSRTTRRFQRLAGMLDPRVGRGFFNTFDARFPFLRWPLDHLFHDERFRLVGVERLPQIGSDHFPMLFELALHESARSGDEPSNADAEDREEADELVQEARKIDRDPVGSDWEN